MFPRGLNFPRMSNFLTSPLFSPTSSSSSSLHPSSSSNNLHKVNSSSSILSSVDPLSPSSSALLVKKLAVPWHTTALHGIDVLKTPRYNKGSAFTLAERKALKIEGLLPPFVVSQDTQVKRTLEYLSRLKDDLLKYDALMQLSERNEKLFYRIISENLNEFMPIIYTPTVGAACLEFGHLFKNPKGLYITLRDRGRVNEILANWPNSVKVRAIVFTDGERILGLGDLGTYGHGIPIGKLMLYTAAGGVDPDSCLPVQIDVGTNNEKLLNDPFYTGLRQKREVGKDYDELIEEFIVSAQARFGKYTLLQFEDFANANASRLLQKYRHKGTIFNDDIQGTAAVAVAGILASLSISGKQHIRQHKIVIFGAGSAGIGIANLLAMAMVRESEQEYYAAEEEKEGSGKTKWTLEDARKLIWLVDSKGLIVESRSAQLSADKLPYAHPNTQLIHLKDIVENLKATALIGCAAQAGVFTEEILTSLCKYVERPIVFALSNPTSQSECTAEQAYQWTQGKAIFASGSPFPPVTLGNQLYKPGQCNNSYIFPGLALAITQTRAKHVSDEQFLISAIALAKQITAKDLETGTVFPASLNIRQVSLNIAVAVAEQIYAEDNATLWPKPANLYQHLKDSMYDYTYDSFVR